MSRTVELPCGRIVPDRDARVCAGLLNGNEVAIAHMDQPARLTIGRIGEADRAIVRHIGMPDHRSGMLRRLWRRWGRRLRWFRIRLWRLRNAWGGLWRRLVSCCR